MKGGGSGFTMGPTVAKRNMDRNNFEATRLVM
jgi:hypothetical protein